MKRLLAHAAELGVSAHVAHLPRDRRGVYDAAGARVILAFDLTPVEKVSVLAHELGHARYVHTCEGDSYAERQADAYAASLLIDPCEYAAAERLSGDIEFIAEELDVIPELVDAFQRDCLTRLRGATYVRAKLGARQWEYRGAHA